MVVDAFIKNGQAGSSKSFQISGWLTLQLRRVGLMTLPATRNGAGELRQSWGRPMSDNPNPGTPPAVPVTPPAAVTSSAPAASPEAARIAALEGQLAAVETALLADVPAHLKALVPAGLAVADRIGWLHQAKAAGLFAVPVVVPTTDTGKPAVTPRDEDLSKLPAFARMARGYQTK
jgi:hypothetical protein